MSYIQGFVVPVPAGNKEAYRQMAASVAPMFAEYGAMRTVECWGEDIPEGKRTDFRRAVKAETDEKIVLAWVFWPDKAACEAAAEKMRSMPPPAEIPFDGKRMIFADFEVASDSGDGGAFGYIDGMVGVVANDKRAAFLDHAAFMDGALKAKGALRVVNGWGTDVPDGQTTDFKRAVEAKDGETVTFGWIEWPDKATHDTGWGSLMAEGIMQQNPPVWDGQRAIFGGFVPILDTDHA